jgi:hypothetical protein
MAGRPEMPPVTPELAGKRLDSWKEIAAYVKRHVTTVRRWEQHEGLPVHRHLHAKLGSIYAYSRELDTWLDSRRRSEAVPVDGCDQTLDEARQTARDVLNAVSEHSLRTAFIDSVSSRIAGLQLSPALVLGRLRRA